MKFKKLVSSAAVLAMATVLLGACGGDKDKDKKDTTASSSVTTTSSTSTETADGELKDGEYVLEEKNENNGYRTVFSIVVTDGKISESNYDNVNAAGESKINDEDYNKQMNDVTKTSPDKFIPELNKELVAKQNPDDIDTVTGATHSTDSFKEYARKLIDAAKKGDTTKIEIDNEVSK